MRLLLILLFFSTASFAQSNESANCDINLIADQEFDLLAADMLRIQDAQNSCDEIPEEDRKSTGVSSPSRTQILGDMMTGCFKGIFKGFINGLKDIITSLWDLLKLGDQLAKKFGSQIVKYLEIAYHGGIGALFGEYARDGVKFMETVLNGLKAIPDLILDAAEKGLAHYQCLNSGARARYVCQTMSYIGTDVLVTVLTAGASKAGYAAKLTNAISTGLTAQRAKYLRRGRTFVGSELRGAKALDYIEDSLSRFNPKKVDRLIQRADIKATKLKDEYFKLDGQLNGLVEQFKAIPRADRAAREAMKRRIKAKALELKQASRILTEHNRKLSHVRSQKLIYELKKADLIEIERVVVDGKSLNLQELEKGRYPPWSEGGPVFEVKIKGNVQLCRGGSRSEATGQAGRWFLPCALDRLRTKADNRWVNATADNPYDIFAQYALRQDDIIQIGGINPILNEFGKQRVFWDKNSGRRSIVRGGGGEVQAFRPDSDNKLGESDLVDVVNVYDDPVIRARQGALRRTNNREEIMRIRSEIQERTDDLEAEAFLRDIDAKLDTLN